MRWGRHLSVMILTMRYERTLVFRVPVTMLTETLQANIDAHWLHSDIFCFLPKLSKTAGLHLQSLPVTALRSKQDMDLYSETFPQFNPV